MVLNSLYWLDNDGRTTQRNPSTGPNQDLCQVHRNLQQLQESELIMPIPFRILFMYCGIEFRAQRYEGEKIEIDQINSEGLAIFLGYARVMGGLGSCAITALNIAEAIEAERAALMGSAAELGIKSINGVAIEVAS